MKICPKCKQLREDGWQMCEDCHVDLVVKREIPIIAFMKWIVFILLCLFSAVSISIAFWMDSDWALPSDPVIRKIYDVFANYWIIGLGLFSLFFILFYVISILQRDVQRFKLPGRGWMGGKFLW